MRKRWFSAPFDLTQALLPFRAFALCLVIRDFIRFPNPAGGLVRGAIVPLLNDVAPDSFPVFFNAIPVHLKLPHVDCSIQNTVVAMPAINSIDYGDHYHPLPRPICALAYPRLSSSYLNRYLFRATFDSAQRRHLKRATIARLIGRPEILAAAGERGRTGNALSCRRGGDRCRVSITPYGNGT